MRRTAGVAQTQACWPLSIEGIMPTEDGREQEQEVLRSWELSSEGSWDTPADRLLAPGHAYTNGRPWAASIRPNGPLLAALTMCSPAPAELCPRPVSVWVCCPPAAC